MQEPGYELGGALDQLMGVVSPVVGVLATLFLVVVVFRIFVTGNTALGDWLDRRGVFNSSISRRPKHGKPYCHPPRSKPGLVQALLVLALFALALVGMMGWTFWRLNGTVTP